MDGERVRTVAGTPRTWKPIRPAAVTADPASAAIPTGYLIWSVTDGAVKRHPGTCSWEIKVGAAAALKVGLHAATPTVQRAGANQAGVTYASQPIGDPPTRVQVQVIDDGLLAAITLLNEIRAALAEKGLIKGGA